MKHDEFNLMPASQILWFWCPLLPDNILGNLWHVGNSLGSYCKVEKPLNFNLENQDDNDGDISS